MMASTLNRLYGNDERLENFEFKRAAADDRDRSIISPRGREVLKTLNTIFDALATPTTNQQSR